MDTRIPLIELALEGKVDFVIKTNPFGGGAKESEKLSEGEAADKLFKLLGGI